MTPFRALLIALTSSLVLISAPVEAAEAAGAEPAPDLPPPEVVAREAADVDDLVMSSEGFLSFHPDLRYRLAALVEYRKGNYAEALAKFKRAARYADKPSQAMVAEMLWQGQGAAVDRPAAYIWMDLAAERGYKMMLVKREMYWAELSPAEQAQAIELGDALYLEIADKYAKPRLESRLRQARMKTTGSRTGFVGTLRIEIPTPGGSRTINGADYYQEQFWKADQYWAMQDSDWKDYGEGRVDIGAVQTLGPLTAPDEAKDKREDRP